MHPARLDHLAGMHAPLRKVTRTDNRADGITFDLECGHDSHMPPNFDPRFVTERRCFQCGEAAVRAEPRYRAEFIAA